MPYTENSDVRLFYEISGPADGDPLVLIHGAGAQLIAWHPKFILELEWAGFRVVRFDNRDVGLSERFDGDRASYQLEDLSDDVIRLLDELAIPAAHIAGQSMGGVIAQQVAIDHPTRTLSLCIIYSAHSFQYLVADEEVARFRSQPLPEDREGRIAHYIAGERLAGVEELDDDYVRALAEEVVDRAWDPAGAARPMEAIGRSIARPERVRQIRVPTAILHGRGDRLISFEASLAMGRDIPDSEVHILPGMGHQIRPSNWPDFVRALRRNVSRSREAR